MSSEQSFGLASSEGDFQLYDGTSHTKKLPASLECLLHRLYQNGIQTPVEYLIAIICYLCFESGLVPARVSAELSSKVCTHWGFSFIAGIPKNSWDTIADQIIQKYAEVFDKSAANPNTSQMTVVPEDIYTFKLKLLNHSDDELQLIIRKIFDDSALCAILCSEHHAHSASTIVPVNEFIKNTTEANSFDHIRHDPEKFFLKTQALSAQIKHQLIEPIRNMIMYDSAYPNAALNGLPKEILWLLFQYFRSDLKTLQKISHTCVYLRNLALTFLHESNIQLKHRRPTPITYDASNHIQPRSRHRIYNVYPWMFDPFNYY